MKDKNRINLENTLDELYNDLEYTKFFYDLSLIFDDIKIFRIILSRYFTIIADIYNLGADKYNKKIVNKRSKNGKF